MKRLILLILLLALLLCPSVVKASHDRHTRPNQLSYVFEDFPDSVKAYRNDRGVLFLSTVMPSLHYIMDMGRLDKEEKFFVMLMVYKETPNKVGAWAIYQMIPEQKYPNTIKLHLQRFMLLQEDKPVIIYIEDVL